MTDVTNNNKPQTPNPSRVCHPYSASEGNDAPRSSARLIQQILDEHLPSSDGPSVEPCLSPLLWSESYGLGVHG
ncbi:MAG: hypothetical protein JNM70_14775 [Anaerolineae bacterium]|nr:hypothetical protein [Anaerolineae bacterium]